MTPRERSKRPSASRVAASVDAKGIYTVPAAARLLGETPAKIHRWAFGYRRRGIEYQSAITTDVAELEGVRIVTFLELVELMFIKGLLATGLSWPKVREASRVAARLLKNERHPFATRRWFVDAASIYLQLGQEHGEELLTEVAGHAQLAMKPVLQPYLTQLEFGAGDVAQRWFPRGPTTPIVVDPRRAFGMPITARGGVPTETIGALHRAGDPIEVIAAWYRLDEAEVAAAVEFEKSLARAA
jgi:uncharacterized protein (DUF433 family)